MTHAHLSLTPRHPELVSGSIGRHALKRAEATQPWGRVAQRLTGPRRAEKWTLKQVQGDENRGVG